MALIVIPNTFSSGATIVASQHNSNFSTISSDYNGNIDNTNIASGAAIAYSKLNLATSIVNADIGASAAIVGSKLDLTSPGAIGSTSANTGAFSTLKVGTTHQGDILYDNATSFVRLTPGTSGQVLMTQGAAANPTWTNGPGMTYISKTALSGVATSGSISVTSGNDYLVKFSFVTLSAADVIILRFNGDSGTHYTAVSGGVSTATSVTLSGTVANSGGVGITGSFYIQQVGTSSQAYQVWGDSAYFDNSTSKITKTSICGAWSNAANITSFAVLTSGGATITTGNVYLYQLINT